MPSVSETAVCKEAIKQELFRDEFCDSRSSDRGIKWLERKENKREKEKKTPVFQHKLEVTIHNLHLHSTFQVPNYLQMCCSLTSHKCPLRDFPWCSSSLDSALPIQGARVRSLVRELDPTRHSKSSHAETKKSCMPQLRPGGTTK